MFRYNIFYNYGDFSKYYEGNQIYETPIKNKAFYNYIANSLSYGITDKFTIETELGYFINKTQVYTKTSRGYGFSNAIISAKYNFYFNPDKRIEWTGEIGCKIPFSKKSFEKDGVLLPTYLWPSTGSYGIIAQSFLIKENPFSALRFFLINRIETNFTTKFEYFPDYKIGNRYVNSFFVTKHLHFPWEWLTENWTVILQLRNEINEKNKQDNKIIPASGNCVFFVTPQINYTIREKWNISILYEFPVYRYYNDVQLATCYSIIFNITRDWE